MKDLNPTDSPVNDNIHEERQEIKQIELQGDLVVPRGHTVYSVDLRSLIVSRLKYKEESTLDLTRGEIGVVVKGKIQHDPNVIVFTSLNDKNALRKVRQHVADLGINPSVVMFKKDE